MTPKEQNKYKLRENECIKSVTLEIDLAVRKQMVELGVEKWINTSKDVAYNSFVGTSKLGCIVHNGYLANDCLNRTPITGTEWLNRHGVFVAGQEVFMHDVRHIFVGFSSAFSNCLVVDRRPGGSITRDARRS